MASLHFRHASVNTAFEPQSDDGNQQMFTRSPRSRTPLGHNRGLSVGTTEKVGEDFQPLLSSDPRNISIPVPKRRNNAMLYALWAFSLVLTAVCTYAIASRSRSDGSLGSFATGYVNELRMYLSAFEFVYHANRGLIGDALSSIRVQRQQFYGSLDFKDRFGFIPPGSPSLKYVGADAEVDAAWDELTVGRYFLLTEQEAREAYGNSIEKYWNVHHGGYVAGLDVLHTLHCLNHIRMSLYPAYYPQDPQHGLMHKAHCVDHLRQLAMCHSDLTPVPTQWFDGLSRNYINSSREHTCRDFRQVREWASERFNGSTAVGPRNRDGTPRDNFYAPWSP